MDTQESKVEDMATHKYIADAAQGKGFRDGTISQAWVPIDFSKINDDGWWKGKIVERVFRRIMDIEGMWRIQTTINGTPFEGMMSCPYAVGDVLVISKSGCEMCEALPDVGHIGMQCPIISVEAKMLGEMTVNVAIWDMGITNCYPVDWWNAAIPSSRGMRSDGVGF